MSRLPARGLYENATEILEEKKILSQILNYQDVKSSPKTTYMVNGCSHGCH